MIDLSLKPGLGAGPIFLGTSRENARSLMADLGYPLSGEHGALDYFCENAIQLEYEDNLIRFIGISEHPDIVCFFGNQDVFEVDADSLFNLFAADEQTQLVESPGDTCFFPSLGLNLWESDEQYDRRGGYKRKVYAQIGLERPNGR